ncbi:two-component system sensor histidine kinase NtrB [Salidesulfovibrio brasiliensis]|uniref:two-component system sensor histidine kinase NtrB n=1 Tax=Salidesulfovibrio brasiliensis TaxID=221711 RepID=UPI0006D1D034|nr:ATP-binding protein [Salidesulfovibrio brasiliensis]
MEIRSKDSEHGPVVALVLALIVLGLGSVFLTWRSIDRQKELVREHMILSGGSILRGVEANLMRIMRGLRGNPDSATIFPAVSGELFGELATSDDIAFVGVYGADGNPLIHSSEETPPRLQFPIDSGLINSGNAWHVLSELGGKEVLVSGLMMQPGLSFMAGGRRAPGRGMGMHGGKGMRHGRMHGENDPDDDHLTTTTRPEAYLVVGINATKHMAQFRQYRRAAILQTGYVFLAAVVLWSLAFAYLRRRDQGRRLDRLEQFQNRLLDHMPDGLVTLDAEGTILAANGSAKLLLAPQDGDPLELVGRNWSEFPVDDMQGNYDWRQYDLEGRRLEILSIAFAEGDDTEELGRRLVLIRDRTRIKSLEEDLDEARRLAAVGQLAAGVAHEVRNPLSSLRGFAQFFAEKLRGQAPLDAYATTMVQEADRLNRVVTDLLYLARPRELAPESVDIAAAADALVKLMRFDLEHRSVEPDMDIQAPFVMADPDGLRQMLLNLMANALDALDGREDGQITLRTTPDRGGTWVIVEDNGAGMDEETREQALEPFFTGKRTGTGLGLAIVQNIMRAHKGRIDIDSEPGRGTAVKLFFPDLEESA